MTNELQIFNFDQCPVRVVLDEAGEPWWVAKDVCEVLGIGNSRQALSYLEADEKGVITNDTPGGRQEMATVNEPGLYSLVLRSRNRRRDVSSAGLLTRFCLPFARRGVTSFKRSGFRRTSRRF